MLSLGGQKKKKKRLKLCNLNLWTLDSLIVNSFRARLPVALSLGLSEIVDVFDSSELYGGYFLTKIHELFHIHSMLNFNETRIAFY